ncbi:PPE domain-containing protein [Williamsia sp. CHRR-6]|uniref:PPE domain-containing protein n=1 Tax=Williamsia sp. CHRR-6 TaxID=2835871 RepID=UPI001BDA56CC|nr:PPE domain-containing protein [Williamsia sp. CHRR-6]MBT0568576.1 PPE domain-containing protein [Williamsia sp. CHRR-6]
MTGFTGVRWEARQAEQLSRDLSRGAGPKPLFEAGMSWGAMALSLSELADDFRHVRKLLHEGYQGEGSADMLTTVKKLEKWVADTADQAMRNAVAAEHQAVALTVALAAMPDADTIKTLANLETAMKAVAAPPGSLIAGGIAKLDEQATGMKAQAARVMASYEHATTPVSKPWEPAKVPEKLVNRAQLAQARSDAEQKAQVQATLEAFAGQQALMAEISAFGGTKLGAYTSEGYAGQTRRTEMRVDTVVDGENVVVKGGDVVKADAVSQQAQFVPAAPMSAAAGSNHSSALPVTTNVAQVQEVMNSGSQVASPQVIGVPEKEASA